jgi:hypothetical protein
MLVYRVLKEVYMNKVKEFMSFYKHDCRYYEGIPRRGYSSIYKNIVKILYKILYK